MKKFLTFRNLLVVLIVFGVGGLGWRVTHKKPKTPIRTVVVEKKDLVSSVSASGKIEARKKAVLKYPTSGRLGYINISVGQVVSKWQLLSGMNLGDLQTAQTEAYYKYLAADANAKQIEDEVKGHDSDETFVQKNKRVAAQTARDIAYDNWLETRRAVSNANLVAPFDGIVTAVTVDVVGASITAVDGVTVVDPSSLYFDTEIDESDIGKVKAGDRVLLKLDAFSGEEFVGSVAEIGFETRLSSSGATVIPVKITIPDGLMAKAKLGLNGDGEIELEKRVGVWVVPVEAVKNGEVELEGGRKIKIETGLTTESEIEVTNGLQGGEKIWLR